MRLTTALLIFAAVSLGGAAVSAFAQTASTGSGQAASTSSGQAYPSRNVRIIVGLSPGGSMDVTARLVADRLKEALGQQIIVDSRTCRT